MAASEFCLINIWGSGGSRSAATFKMEHFLIIVAAVLDPPLWCYLKQKKLFHSDLKTY